MSIQPLGFLDVSSVTAYYVLKYRKQASDGVLRLREIADADVENLPVLKEWNSARALLSRIRTSAAPFFDGVTPELGRAWIEVLPPQSGTPWTIEDGDYAETHIRTRTCLIPCPGALTYSGAQSAALLVGMVSRVDHRQMCSEVNLGEHARVHLVVDVRVPDAPDAGA